MTHELVPFNFPEIEILLIDTKVKHALGDSAYNNRREACEMGVALMRRQYDVSFLRDVTMGMLHNMKEDFPDDIFRRCSFVVNEMNRTRLAVEYLKQSDIQSFGDLLYKTHEGLSLDYEVSCAESDFLVAQARPNKKILGARQMGGGFGGCTINLINKTEVPSFKESITAKYYEAFKREPEFYSVSIVDGVGVGG